MCSLRVRASEPAVGRDEDRGVEAEPVLALGALVQRGVHVRARLGGELGGEAVRGAAGQLLRLDPGGAGAARVGGEVAAERELLQAHQQRARAGGAADAARERGTVLVGVGVPALLHGGDPERRSLRVARARRRGGRRGRGDQWRSRSLRAL